ncbi:MAG: hypothetical protein L6277_07940 [Desulfobacterales bacterium]|nr:hypothetical protein [Pseudomonadota bacterium]MBU4354584.1 hypothetical protein [Pseudomonadota bacterium]MCG2772002.1 hypothetical protein [Desulfobacterales bacterium]
MKSLNLMQKLVLVGIIVLMGLFPPWACGTQTNALPAPASQPTQEKSPLIEDLSKTLGFCMGQRFTLERIKKTFPDLALPAQKAMLEFKASFGSAEENIIKVLQGMLKKQYSEYSIKMKNQIQSIFSSQQLNRQDATKFLSEVESRAKGQIPSSVLETLLTYRFIDNPAEEFLRGYTRVFRTKDHPKAKGCDFQISYPASWRPKEGERPNIIQKFISQNGHGLEVVMLMVKDLSLPPGYKPSHQELEEFFTEKDLMEMVPEGARVISAKPIVLDNHKGGMILFDQTLQRLDMTITMRSLHFITISSGKMIFMQCMVSTLPGKEAELQERFNRFEPLFKLMANRFILQDQYK